MTGRANTKFADTPAIADWMRQKGYSDAEIGKISKVQKGKLTTILTPDDYEELKRIGMVEESESAKTLQPKK